MPARPRYEVRFAPRAERAFSSLDRSVQRRLARRIDALAGNPRPRGVNKLVGEEDLYRLRVGDYRVVYRVRDRELLVLVLAVGHRRDVHQG